MSFGGHVLDMVRRMKSNRAQLEARRERTSDVKQTLYSDGHHPKKYIVDKKIPKEKLDRILEEIRESKRLEQVAFRRKTFLAMVIITIIIFLLIAGLGK